MRCGSFAIALLFAACSSAPIGFSAEELQGAYRFNEGPDIWEELHLEPEGRCTSWWVRAVGGVSRTRSTGHWSLDAGTVKVEMDPPDHSNIDKTSLVPRRWKGHVYLVPRARLSAFDAYGPDPEFCFYRYDAPMAEPPPYRLSEPAADAR